MRAAFDDAAVVEHQHLVGVADRAEAVGHDEGGSSGKQDFQGPLDAGFGHAVDAAGGFVEDQNPRIGQQGPGETDELFLARRNADAPLADFGVQAVGKAFAADRRNRAAENVEDFRVGRVRAGRRGCFRPRCR